MKALAFGQQLHRLFGRADLFSRRCAGPGAGGEFLQRRKNLLSVQFRFALADSGDLQQLSEGGRTAAAEFFERGVVQDDVRGHALPLGYRSAPLPHVLAQLRINGSGGGRRDRHGRGGSRRFLRRLLRLRCREPLRLGAANIAHAAGFPLRRLAEMEADLPMAARGGLGEAPHSVISLPGSLPFRRIGDTVDEMRQQSRIALLPEQDAIGRSAIAPRASGLLVILLDRLGQGKMNHRAHRGLIDPQPEGQCAHQHRDLVGHPALLVAPAPGGIHLAVVGNSRDPVLGQEIHRFIHPDNGGGVDDRVAVGVREQGLNQQTRLRAAVAFPHQVAQIGPVEADDVLIRLSQLELLQDIVPYELGGAGGERGYGAVREILAQGAQLAILRTELMAPFGNTVRFVDGEEGDRRLLQPADGVRPREALRREIQQAVFAGAHPAHHLRLLVGGHRAVQHGGGNTHLRQLRGLVLHQGDQRRDHDGGAAEHDRGQLIAERLSAAGRHHDTDVATGQQTAHYAFLRRAKPVVAPVTA